MKLSITAGVGSDHVDLHAAADSGMTVAEVTGIPPLVAAIIMHIIRYASATAVGTCTTVSCCLLLLPAHAHHPHLGSTVT